ITSETLAQFPPTDDEQIVNAALVLFLKAVTMHFVGDVYWTFHRKAFRIGNGGKKNKPGYEARVDGYLCRCSDNKVMAILETKPCVRQSHDHKILMQESAQMAAWISQFPENYKFPPGSDRQYK